jgi:hypothetical protein
MKRVHLSVLTILLLALACTQAATFCEQELFFLVKPAGPTDCYWIGESVGGECSFDQIVQVFVRSDGAEASVISLKRETDWRDVREFVSSIEAERFLTLQNDEGVFALDDPAIAVLAPASNPELLEAFSQLESSGGSCEGWNNSQGGGGIVQPRFAGCTPTLAYYYPKGLYIDYQIAAVHYFAASRSMLIITEQPRRAVGLDTMHGFMIFRLD